MVSTCKLGRFWTRIDGRLSRCLSALSEALFLGLVPVEVSLAAAVVESVAGLRAGVKVVENGIV